MVDIFEVDEVVGVARSSRFTPGATLHRVVKANKRYITLDDGQVFLASSLRRQGAGDYDLSRLIKGNEAIRLNQTVADQTKARDAARKINEVIATLKPIDTSHNWASTHRENVKNRVEVLRAALAAAEEVAAELA